MTPEEALKIAADPLGNPPHAVIQAARVLADALREAQAAVVQMREVVRQDHCDYGDACVLHKMKEVVSTLPAPAARTYEDGVRDAARVVRARSERTFGQQTTTANGYADAIEALLSPAPAVAPVAAFVPPPMTPITTPTWETAVQRAYKPDPAEPVAAPKPGPFDAEAALVAMKAEMDKMIRMYTHGRSSITMGDLNDLIDVGLGAGRKP